MSTNPSTNRSSGPAREQAAETKRRTYRSAVAALSKTRPPRLRPSSAPPRLSASHVPGRLRRAISDGPEGCRSRAAQAPQRRAALRENTPPWSVRLEHRFPGKLLNVSRTGLAIETREAPPFYPRGRLRVDVRGEPVDLLVAVQWCRLVGLEQVETECGVETAPRFQVGLGCADPALGRLGAPPACGGE